MHEFIGFLYRLVGRLLLRRDCYVLICRTCRIETEEFFPYHGAFMWEKDYWGSYQPEACCDERPMAVLHSFDAVHGALYRLPGYKKRQGRRLAS